jgi:hypothetical protein
MDTTSGKLKDSFLAKGMKKTWFGPRQTETNTYLSALTSGSAPGYVPSKQTVLSAEEQLQLEILRREGPAFLTMYSDSFSY